MNVFPADIPKITVPVITGATGSGKTSLVEEIFTGSAALCPSEIISADSMQVYRGMDIGTAKPPPSLQDKLPHHLIDIREPDEQFNAGDFVRLAGAAIADIAGRGKLPVVCGGTFFYLANLIGGLAETPPSSAAVRQKVKAELAAKGPEALMAELAARDAESARRIHLHDEYRLVRALEVVRCSGRPLSSFRPTGAAAGEGGRFRFLVIVVERPRQELYRLIDRRAATMMRSNLRQEVEALFAKGYMPPAPGLRAIGYREFFAERPDEPPSLIDSAFDSEIEKLIAQNTRRYAKRQVTGLRAMAEAVRVPLEDTAASRRAACRLIRDLIPRV
jgi:tRNA dimethylallyltransferase